MKFVHSILTLGVLFAGSASAGVIYSNGPVNGTNQGWTINFGFAVTDSFTANGETATSFDFGAWLLPGDTANSVDWSIGTTQYGSDIASGTATLTNTFLFNGSGYGIYTETGSLGSVALGTGTYWFTLQNASASNGDPMYWDENDGPSTANENSLGSIGSETFTIYSGTTTPEPGTMSMIGAGLLFAGSLLRRKVRK